MDWKKIEGFFGFKGPRDSIFLSECIKEGKGKSFPFRSWEKYIQELVKQLNKTVCSFIEIIEREGIEWIKSKEIKIEVGDNEFSNWAKAIFENKECLFWFELDCYFGKLPSKVKEFRRSLCNFLFNLTGSPKRLIGSSKILRDVCYVELLKRGIYRKRLGVLKKAIISEDEILIQWILRKKKWRKNFEILLKNEEVFLSFATCFKREDLVEIYIKDKEKAIFQGTEYFSEVLKKCSEAFKQRRVHRYIERDSESEEKLGFCPGVVLKLEVDESRKEYLKVTPILKQEDILFSTQTNTLLEEDVDLKIRAIKISEPPEFDQFKIFYSLLVWKYLICPIVIFGKAGESIDHKKVWIFIFKDKSQKEASLEITFFFPEGKPQLKFNQNLLKLIFFLYLLRIFFFSKKVKNLLFKKKLNLIPYFEIESISEDFIKVELWKHPYILGTPYLSTLEDLYNIAKTIVQKEERVKIKLSENPCNLPDPKTLSDDIHLSKRAPIKAWEDFFDLSKPQASQSHIGQFSFKQKQIVKLAKELKNFYLNHIDYESLPFVKDFLADINKKKFKEYNLEPKFRKFSNHKVFEEIKDFLGVTYDFLDKYHKNSYIQRKKGKEIKKGGLLKFLRSDTYLFQPDLEKNFKEYFQRIIKHSFYWYCKENYKVPTVTVKDWIAYVAKREYKKNIRELEFEEVKEVITQVYKKKVSPEKTSGGEIDGKPSAERFLKDQLSNQKKNKGVE